MSLAKLPPIALSGLPELDREIRMSGRVPWRPGASVFPRALRYPRWQSAASGAAILVLVSSFALGFAALCGAFVRDAWRDLRPSGSPLDAAVVAGALLGMLLLWAFVAARCLDMIFLYSESLVLRRDRVELRRAGFRNALSRTEPLSGYSGIAVFELVVPGRWGFFEGWAVGLRHQDASKNVPLEASFAGGGIRWIPLRERLTPEDLALARRRAEFHARELGLPCL